MLNFTKVRWKNFLSTGNNFTEIILNKNHKTIFLGPSGSGKSTILDAICFALFNKPFRNVNKNNLVNSINNKDCVTEIEFTIGKREYKIVRGIKPNIFEIYINGSLINQDASVRDYQKYLETEILKFNIKSFRQIVVLGAASFVPFMQLKPQDRRTIIEELLDIEVFSLMNTILKQKTTAIKSEIESCNFQLNLLDEKIQIHEGHLQNLKENQEKKIEENLEKIKEGEEQIKNYEEKIEKLRADIEILNEKILIETDLNDKASKVESTIRMLARKIVELEKSITFYKKNSDCPTCKQTITEDFKTKVIDESNDEIVKSRESKDKANSVKEKIESKLSIVQDIKSKIKNIESQISAYRVKVNSAKQYNQKIQKENENLDSSESNTTETIEKIESLKAELENKRKEHEALITQKSIQDTASELLKDSGVKARIIKQYLPLINKYTNKFLTSMDFFVTFSMDEEFNEAIKSRGRDDFVYSCFSEGEKQRIDLALLFTWRTIARMKNSVNTNLLIMDEVFDSYLDNSATENVIHLLDSDMFKHANIFVISHKNNISDKFDQTVRFEKQKNFSKIVGGNSDYKKDEK